MSDGCVTNICPAKDSLIPRTMLILCKLNEQNGYYDKTICHLISGIGDNLLLVFCKGLQCIGKILRRLALWFVLQNVL